MAAKKTPRLEIPPEYLQRFAATAAFGGNPQEAFESFLEVMSDAGIPSEILEDARRRGPKLLQKWTSAPKKWKALAGGLEASQLIDKAGEAAAAAAQGIPESTMLAVWQREVGKLTRENPQVARRLKSLPSGTVGSAVRGLLGGGGGKAPPQLPGGGKPQPALPAPEPGTGAAAVAGAPVKRRFRAKAAALGAAANLLMPLGAESPLTLPGRPGRAKSKAVESFAQLGASSSGEVLASIVRQQEMATRRNQTLKAYEPELYQNILSSLMLEDRPPSSLTDTERRIGGAQTAPTGGGRDQKDVEFLLTRLMNELGGG